MVVHSASGQPRKGQCRSSFPHRKARRLARLREDAHQAAQGEVPGGEDLRVGLKGGVLLLRSLGCRG